MGDPDIDVRRDQLFKGRTYAVVLAALVLGAAIAGSAVAGPGAESSKLDKKEKKQSKKIVRKQLRVRYIRKTKTLRFKGVNVQIVNGLEKTATKNRRLDNKTIGADIPSMPRKYSMLNVSIHVHCSL